MVELITRTSRPRHALPRTRVSCHLRLAAWRTVETAALVSSAVGALSLVPLLPPPLRAALLAVFTLTGPGLAVVMWLRLLQPAATVVAVPVIGLSVCAGFTSILAWLNVWMSVVLLLTLVAVVSISALTHSWSVRDYPSHRRHLFTSTARPIRWRVSAPLILTLLALCAWIVLLPGLRNAQDSPFGLLFVGTGPGLIVIVVAIVVAFIWALRTNRILQAALAIVATIIVLRVTATLITEVPIYAYTYTHIGVVDYLLQSRTLPPRGIDVYSEWPAFFTTFVWFSDVASVDPLTIAHWFAPTIHGLLAVVIGGLALLVGLNIRQALAAAMIAELLNWVGQDYFAPQALAMVMAVGVLALLTSSITYPPAGYLALLAFAVLIPTHQLTPCWLLGAIVLLAATRIIHPWWLPIPYAAMLIGYLIPRLYLVSPYGLFSGPDPFSNGALNPTDGGSLGKLLTLATWRGLTAVMFLLAVIGVIVWWRRGWRFGIPAIIAFTPFSILFVQNYGGEAVFRVYLYALPGCAILIAPLLVMAITQHARQSPRPRLGGWVAATGLAVVGAAGLQSYYGTWFLNVETRSQIALFGTLLAGIKGPATLWSLDSTGLLTRGTADYVKLAQFDKDYDTAIVNRWPGFAQDFPNAHQFDDLTGVAAQASGQDTYFIFTKQSIDDIEYGNFLTRAAVEEFEDQFRHSEFWTVRLANDRTTVYQFNPNYAVSGSPG